ncbi:MAG: DMT family transporter [Leptolyngbyaceae cyanobacterium bins.302]|nr:DMT family transporter [Leptolyngbyaceae cyanobacterium bins.302]
MQYPTQQPQASAIKTPAIATVLPLCIAVLSIASAAILIKLSEQEINPYATAFNRFWITTAILAVWNGVGGLWQRWQETDEYLMATDASFTLPTDGMVIVQLCLVGLFLAADLMLWAWSLTQTSVANATLLANLTPVFSCLGGWLLLNKRFDRRFVLGMGVAIVAIFLIGLDDCQIALGKFAGDAAALVAALSFSVYLAVLERLQTRLSTATVLFWSSASATIVTLPVVLLTGGNLFPTSMQGWLAVLALAVVCQILGQGMLVHSLNELSAEFVALFLLLEPILAGIGAWILFSEQLSGLNLVAFAIALMGIYLSISSPSAMRQTANEPIYLGELTVELAPATSTAEVQEPKAKDIEARIASVR